MHKTITQTLFLLHKNMYYISLKKQFLLSGVVAPCYSADNKGQQLHTMMSAPLD